ncbi:DUF2844 domain-containing protein [Paraburkholderia sp. DHOC27]|uniref:DUF2844 domain-containing protein n=1 Tax=Paraburkholderia sp. DHOC27 TaxID=2303330 RepID=UPI000E3D3704|nr:DUF2844 domain-containing protein [Paraburkholderia sp. DHOC27]RFU46502.1 DUF2844 domain-containing protein [Paraburkholderia sp. DHOC27]
MINRHRSQRVALWTALASASGTALLVALPAASAYAELGGTMPGSPASAAPGTSAGNPVPLLNGAVLKRTSLDAGGTTVNEYASNSGQIFAYTWQGPTMPDLPALLGAYAPSWRAGAIAANDAVGLGGAGLHESRVTRSDVVVEAGGQMRSYVGRAWLPAALPPGVTPDALQ